MLLMQENNKIQVAHRQKLETSVLLTHLFRKTEIKLSTFVATY